MKRTVLPVVAMLASISTAFAFNITGPDGKLDVSVDLDAEGRPCYSVTLDGKTMLRQSPLGFESNIGSFTTSSSIVPSEVRRVEEHYTLDRIKKSSVDYRANEATVSFETPGGGRWEVEFRVSDHDVAFRYRIPRQGDTGAIYISSEASGFRFPAGTTTFLTPQRTAMENWKRTSPSYEEVYTADAPMDAVSQYGQGYTFPCLFRVGDDGWVLLSETGVDSYYCGSHLSDYRLDGLYTIAYPMPEENNGNGNAGAAMALPGHTPWRTITVGRDLAPIVETTVPWDLVSPRYDSAHSYEPGCGTWSWIVWQDKSINMEDQKAYIDFAHEMGYRYVLVDNWWDTQIGRDRLPELAGYARSKGVSLIMWYSSSGYWNDIEQGPINCMDNPIRRKAEMRWLRSLGVKGIKVDFFGGDKQETMRLYEAILSDADDHGLMVIFHGCTLPRGWERMYPNYVGSEAVRASENMYFTQQACDDEAFNATLHPFIRNSVGCMEFGGCFMNKHISRNNRDGHRRMTSDAFQLATTVLFQNPVQNFAITPYNLEDAPAVCMDYLREVPTVWDETRFIEGYPGRYVVLARRHADKWYIAGVNATDKPVTVTLDCLAKGDAYRLYCDDADRNPVRKDLTAGKKVPAVTMQPGGGFVVIR
ncbi:MAG: glycoside hydrolase family 97 protein [Duncaniella sp.]|nr:glycoside hydrolase family 97 protein [Duncaniella sp.]